MEVQGLWEAVQPRLHASIRDGLSVGFIADFCRATNDTVIGWDRGDHPAKGEKLIRLWHLMAFVGHDSPELETLQQLQRFVSELFAFDVIGTEKACEIFNLKSDRPSHMYHVLRGQDVLRPNYTYDTAVSMFWEELSEMKKIVRDEISEAPGLAFLRKIHLEQEVQQSEHTPGQTDVELTDFAVLTASPDVKASRDTRVLLASLVSAIQPVAKAVLSDDFSPEERSEFREMVSNETLFEVTNALNALSSERARNNR